MPLRHSLLLFLLALPGVLPAVTLQEVIQGYINAQGGEEAIKTVHSLRLEGVIIQGDATVPFIQFKKVPNLMRTIVELPQGEFISGYDGKTAWMKSRVMQHSLAMEPEAAAATATSAPLFSQLYTLRDQPDRLLLLGSAEIDGESCYEVQARPDSGQDITFFVSAENFLEKKVEFIHKSEGKLSRTEVYYSAERKVPPLTIPFLITTYQDGKLSNEIRIEKAAINPGIYSDYFSPPGGIRTKEEIVAEQKKKTAPPAKAVEEDE